MNDFFTSLLSLEWLRDLFILLLQVAVFLVNLILTPFSVIISSFIPELDVALSNIAGIITQGSQYLGWLLSALAIPPFVITIVLAYYGFVISVSLATWASKLFLKWKGATVG